MKIKVTPVYRKTDATKTTTVVNVGGARSSKSYSIAQLLIDKMVNEDFKTFGILRKTFPALRMTTYKVFIDLLKMYGLYRRNAHNKSEHTYTYRNNIVYFFSLDDPEKIKSSEFNYIWMEEANEFTEHDYTILWLRLSGRTQPGEKNQIFLSLNPVDENCWIAKLEGQDDVEFVWSNYKDNPFLEQSYIDRLLKLIDKDENYHRIYVLGRWGRETGLIYPHYKIVEEVPTEYKLAAYGLDFGYTNPTALTKIMDTEEAYFLEEKIYRTHLTNSDLIEELKGFPKLDIFADPSEPDRIKEISLAGFTILPANNEVLLGIDYCKRKQQIICGDSPNLLKEISGYRHKMSRERKILESPIDFDDHAMASFRYGVMGLVELVFNWVKEKPEKVFAFRGIKSKVF